MGLLRSPSRRKAAPTGDLRIPVGAALCRDGLQSRPDNLKGYPQ
ncbi:alpha/beta fold hydrolase [Pseudomonas sp. S37]|nr:alpha/beta fold hydrolase [Pseudomonas sp. S37]